MSTKWKQFFLDTYEMFISHITELEQNDSGGVESRWTGE